MSNCTNQTTAAGQAPNAGLDLDKLASKVDRILECLSHNEKSAAYDTALDVSLMVNAPATHPSPAGSARN